MEIKMEKATVTDKVLISKDGKTKEVSLEKICKELRVSPAQVALAIRTGHRLKTYYFDEAL
jgi:hypothetical protein